MENRICEKEYFLNSFALIGLKDYPMGTRITPKCGMMLGNRRRLNLAAGTAGQDFMHYSEQVVKALYKGYLPIVMTDLVMDGVLRYETEMFAGPLKDAPMDGMKTNEENHANYLRVRMSNLSDKPLRAAMRLDFSEQFTATTAVRRPMQVQTADGYLSGKLDGGYVWAAKLSPLVFAQTDGSAIVFSAELESGGSADFHVRIPFVPVGGLDSLRLNDDAADCRREVEQFWESVLERGALIDIRTYAEKLASMGIPASEEEVLNSSLIAARYLRRSLQPAERVYVIGEQSIKDELLNHGISLTARSEEADCVVLSWDRQFSYEKLNAAYQAALRGARIIASNPDVTCPLDGGELRLPSALHFGKHQGCRPFADVKKWRTAYESQSV